MTGNRSVPEIGKTGIIRSHIDCKRWLQRTPTVEEACPARCPVCGAAARPVGGPRGLHGHGLRLRQLRGPPAPGRAPIDGVIQVRRYECQHCPAILTVVPCETVPRRHYAATAIAFALALYGLGDQSHAEVRAQISPSKVVAVSAERRWCTLSRWIDAVAARALWPAVPAIPLELPRRAIAARAAMAVGAHAPPTAQPGAPAVRAFLGAAHMP